MYSHAQRGNEKNGVGNRLDRKENKAELAPDVWKYNAFNQLTEQNGISYQYSKNGHLIKSGKKNDQGQIAIDPTGTIPLWEFTYNTEERLTEVRKNNATVALYQYNPLGQRTTKTLPAENTTVHYLYSQEGMVGEYDDTGQLIQEYSWKPNSMWMTDPLFTRTADNRVHFYINDHLGTPQKAFKRNGKVTWEASASAFGETEVWEQSELRNNLRFAGQYFDRETGLHYNFFRDYDPEKGRYVQSDPIGLVGGVNVFAYTGNNPRRYIDKKGLALGVVNAITIAELLDSLNTFCSYMEKAIIRRRERTVNEIRVRYAIEQANEAKRLENDLLECDKYAVCEIDNKNCREVREEESIRRSDELYMKEEEELELEFAPSGPMFSCLPFTVPNPKHIGKYIVKKAG